VRTVLGNLLQKHKVEQGIAWKFRLSRRQSKEGRQYYNTLFLFKLHAKKGGRQYYTRVGFEFASRIPARRNLSCQGDWVIVVIRMPWWIWAELSIHADILSIILLIFCVCVALQSLCFSSSVRVSLFPDGCTSTWMWVRRNLKSVPERNISYKNMQ